MSIKNWNLFDRLFLKIILVIGYSIFSAVPISLQAQSLTQYINPIIGTGGHGHTFPGATVPFGMMQLSPDTRLTGWDGCSGYHYDDSIIYGFTHTHLSGTGCSDYGDILLMPMAKKEKPFPQFYASSFTHATEKSKAGCYEVILSKPNVKVQLTTSARCGMHQYTFAPNSDQYIALDLQHRDEVIDSEIEIVYPNKIRGYRFSKAWAKNQKVFFEIEFNMPFVDVQFYNNDTICKHPYIRSKNIKALFAFGKTNKKILAKVAISGVDNTGAAQNAEKEMPDFDFEKYKKNADIAWQKSMSNIIPKNENSLSTEDKIKFYTALYHCYIQPNIYNDVDYRYRGMDDKIHSTKGKFNYYTVFSIWDTYRAWHPLMTILEPQKVNDFILTFLAQFDAAGKLPIWELSGNETDCMIGNHAASIIWDAYSKGINNYDADKAYNACVAMATNNRADINSVKKYGYVRADDDAESVSKTLELAYDDWCVGQMGNAILLQKNKQIQMGQLKIDSLQIIMNGWDNYLDTVVTSAFVKLKNTVFQDSISYNKILEMNQSFTTRSNNWQNVFDPTTGFMRAIKNGTLYTPFSPYTVDNNYTEANSWQYSFYAPHDVQGLINIHGGIKKFTEKLNDLFAAKSQTEGREQADITGLIGQYAHGNEPSHHIAYLYNYSLQPQTRKKLVDTILKEMYTTKPDGYIGNEDCGQMSAWYVMSQLGLYQIAPGAGTYEYDAAQFSKWQLPNKVQYPSDEIDIFRSLHGLEKPNLSVNNANTFIANPFINNAPQMFTDSQRISMQCLEKDAAIFYTINGEEPKMYVAPFLISDKSSIIFYSAKDTRKSPEQIAVFYKLPTDRAVFIASKYNKNYSGGGPDALIDGIAGDLDWRKGNWQGYQSQDFEASVLFDKAKSFHSIDVRFLQDQKSWIFYPTSVLYYGSFDGINYELLGTTAQEVSRMDDKNEIKTMSYIFTQRQLKINYKSIKIIAKNYGTLPAWHLGAGGDAFIFVDEISVQ
jgi:putative alpha-1,2-mannosidase